MEPVYPWLAYNLKRPHMTPLRVETPEQDAALSEEWENLYGIARGSDLEPKRKLGRPRKTE